MMSQPRVTVLMTVYNGLPYLRQAVESVLSQTLADFEFVIIDDASRDGSAQWLSQCRDERLRVYRNQENRGQAWSLNRGLGLARGAYVARLDQDDVCLPERLAKQVAWLDAHPVAAAVGTLMAGIDVEGRRNGWVLGRTQDNYGSFVASLLLGLTPVCHPSVMFRRTLILELGGYDESFAPAEDVELWTRLAIRRYDAGVLREVLVLSRMHDGQQSVTRAASQQRNIRRSQERLLEAFSPKERVAELALLWRRDPSLWSVCGSRARWEDLFRGFNELVARLKLADDERAAFTRMVDRWLGPGVRMGSMLARAPSAVFYPAFCLLAPLLIPPVRVSCARVAEVVRRWKSARLAQRS